ncbi:MAG: T9SS type A sorting domain-containing protein, partial [Bacteroidales bacterium]
SNNGTAAISWKALNEITTLKTTSNAKTGTATMVLAIDDIPGILKIDARSGSATCTSGNHNDLQISESADNKTFENPVTLNAGSSQNASINLLPTTRYIKFFFNVKANGIFNGSFCGHEFDPVKLTLPKSIYAPEKDLQFNGIIGDVKDTLHIEYSNPQGELMFSCENTGFDIRKISETELAGTEGTALFEINYLSENENTETATVRIYDSANEMSQELVQVTATASILYIPSAPASVSTNKVSKSFAQIAWTKVEGEVREYMLTLKSSDETIIEEIATAELNHTFRNLFRNTPYNVEIKTVAENGNVSESVSHQFVTTNDFGDQLLNCGFEAWEGSAVTTKPANWNSFGSVTGSLESMARVQQIIESAKTRPGSTGKASAAIYSRRAIFSIPANGNMTTGRINAGATNATDPANHNFTDPTNPEFHQKISDSPDSATVWVYYKPYSATSGSLGARVSFILHGENGTDIVKEPSPVVSPLVSSNASLNYNENGEWIRLCVPFEKAEPTEENTPKFMLASFATNKTPGADTGGADSVYIDDLVLIYTPTLTAGALSAYNLQEGDTFELPYTLTGSMSVSNINAPANTVFAELSDENGSFENAVAISEPLTTDESGTILAQLPAKMITSSNYRLRVVTTNYPMNAEIADNLHIEGSEIETSVDKASTKECKLYPNPAKDRIFVTDADESNYSIYNISHQCIATGRNNFRNGIDISALPTGVYFIKLRTELKSQTLRFIKE